MTYEPKRYTAQLMRGIALHLAQSDFPAVYRETGSYEPGERGIYFETSPALDVPDPIETLVITPYQPGSGRMAIEVTRIQFRMRHFNRGRLEVRDLMDDLKAQFPEEQLMMFGGHFFDRVSQVSATDWVEPDRQEIIDSSQNFTFRGNRYQP